jgi:tetratricopeptide (TPR) repeat protein
MRGELDWIVMKCLEKDRTRRYQTANGLARDLEHYLRNEPVEACPPSTGYRLRKFIGRHWRGLASALAFVLLLVTGVVMLTFALIAVNRERQEKAAALEAEGRRRKQARTALDAMSSQIIENWLTQQQELLTEHKQFLEQALHSYEEFAADTGHEEESRVGVADAYGRVGFIKEKLGHRKEAEAAFERCRELYAGLVTDFPDVPAYRQALANIYRHLGYLYRFTGRPAEAEAVLRQGLTIHRNLVAEFPGTPDYQLNLVRSLTHWGILHRNFNRAREAEAAYREALDILKPLTDQFPTQALYRDELARVYNDLGTLLDVNAGRSREAKLDSPDRSAEAATAYAQAVAIYERLAAENSKARRYREQLAICRDHLAGTLRDAQRYAEAEETFRQALTTHKQLVREFPSMPNYQRAMAITLNNLGILLKNTDRAREAEKVYRQALEIHKQLAAEFPEIPDHQNEVAGAIVNVARLCLIRKDLDGARRLLEEALPYHQAALKVHPRHPAYCNFYRLNRWRMTETLLELKEHAAAAETAGQFLQAAVDPPRDAYTAACLLAGCVPLAARDERLPESKRQKLATTYGDSALAALRQAVAKGAKEVSKMNKDPSLDPLRQREDFQKLLNEWKAKNKP